MDWLTYSIEDFLMFSPSTYFRLFAAMNEGVWPLPLMVVFASVFMVWFLLRPSSMGNNIIVVLLCSGWFASGLIYFSNFYADISWAAHYFAAVFAVQAVLVFSAIGRENVLSFGKLCHWIQYVGVGLFVGILVFQASVPWLEARPVMQAELFGLSPDTTALGSLALFLAAKRSHFSLFIIPTTWLLINTALLSAMDYAFYGALLAVTGSCIVLKLFRAYADRRGEF